MAAGARAAARRGMVVRRTMKRILDFFWPVVGFAAVAVSLWLLHSEFKGEAVGPEVWEHLKSISLGHYLLAMLSTLVAYAALAWYDRIALLHLGVKNISWVFISLCSFTTYALAHNIGATVFSGGMVRYRAYHSKGLSAAQVAVLVAICSLTFALGTVLLGGIISVLEPEQLSRFRGKLPEYLRSLTDPTTARLIGVVFLSGVAIYVIGSIFRFKPLMIRGFRLEYPKPGITVRQLLAAPLELLGAAGIIFFRFQMLAILVISLCWRCLSLRFRRRFGRTHQADWAFSNGFSSAPCPKCPKRRCWRHCLSSGYFICSFPFSCRFSLSLCSNATG